MEPPLGTQQGAMQPLVADNFEACLLDKVDQRRRWVSQMVDEVQKVVYHLTTEISNQDIRFQAIPYSLMYNGNITVLSPSQFLVTVPVRGLSGYREAREQRWRYYTLQGARLTCPQRSPEGLQQWLEVQQFMKNLWQWHKADVSIEGDIVPAKVLQVFRKLVENAIETCHLSVVWVLPVGPLALSLAAELPAGRAGAAGAPGRGRGLPPAVLPGPAADEGGRLVSRAEACDHVPPPADSALLDLREVSPRQGLAGLQQRAPAPGEEAAQVRAPALPEALLRAQRQPPPARRLHRAGRRGPEAGPLPEGPRVLLQAPDLPLQLQLCGWVQAGARFLLRRKAPGGEGSHADQ
ncbi:PREDICTED: protein mab-21-like 3 isoform X3 [Myotis brandtii]|uniref:protein mab-21-like 3 isoform X3 n=1 Tax=Myotis brandtii TaxID=109478 RepID=UPI000703F262|nr:PREDICTED: protein mab-21-like 3 isoform X3 [Myotis brandtii]